MAKRACIPGAVFFALLIWAGCGGGAGAKGGGQTGPEGAGSAGEPGAEEEAPGEGEGTSDQRSREALLEETLARAVEIQGDLEELRSLEFESEVPAERQTTEGFREYLEAEIDRELSPKESEEQSAALFHLGLIEEEIDLASSLKDALASQVSAYYDPREGKFFVVLLSSQAEQMDTVAAHELSHALQDQHFDLRAYYGEEPEQELSEDELQARRFVVEGEATLLMMAYYAKAVAGQNPLDGAGQRALETQLEMLAATSVDDQVKMAKMQGQGMLGMDEETRAALESLDDIPRYIIVPLMESYTKGALPVMKAYSEGGWEAVDALYRDPPESTEQVLHPEEKLVKERDYPVALTLPAVEDWEELHADVLGELVWRVYFENWTPDGEAKGWAAAAAGGWDGDHVRVLRRGEEVAGVLATTWDSEEEAASFEEAYLATLPERFSGATLEEARRATWTSRPDGAGEIAVTRRGADVFIVDGAPSRERARAWLRRAVEDTKRERHPSER